MSEELNSELYYRISDLPIASAITGREVVEAVQDGKNVRFSLEQLFVAGHSAYEIALDNGFIGSQLEWLKSLVGASSFEVAVKNGFKGTEADWLLTLKGDKGDDGIHGQDGQSAFQIAVKNGYEGTEVDWLLTLVGLNGQDGKDGIDGTNGKDGVDGQNGVDGKDGKSAYQSAVEGGFKGTEADFINAISGASFGNSKGGAIFITAITPQNPNDNVGDFAYSPDEISVWQCASTTKELTVKVLALTGYSKYRPSVTVNGINVPLTAKADAPLFEGTVNITLDDTGVITAKHEDGAQWISRVRIEALPVITSATFNGGYPAGQTELKADDTFSILFTTDVDVTGYEIEDSGAFVAASGSFVAGKGAVIQGLKVANRGTDTTVAGFRLRVKKANGATSEWYNSADAGNINGVNTVKLNNQYPVITFGAINYPDGQQALKDAESATVNHTVTNFDDIQYSSTDLTIDQPTTFEPAKLVTRLAGGYNTATKNFNVKATRKANGAVVQQGVVVAIAHTAPIISVSTPAARLRSGGNAGTVAQKHVITINSDQALVEAPTLNAPEGTWIEPSFTPNAAKTVWTRTLQVHDDNAKGSFSWNSLKATSLSGQVQETIFSGGDYVLGGFVFRTLTVPAFPNRMVDIGTHVGDTSKLRSTNLSKGASGSLNFTYQNSKTEAVNRYTIVNDAGDFDANGDNWYNADGGNASSNTGGTMKIEIEEVV